MAAKKAGMIPNILNHIFIDGLSAMAVGLFATLIVGTILEQVGVLIGGTAGGYITAIAAVAKSLTGAGIGVGVACKYKESPLVTISAAACGMVGAFASKLLAGTVVAGSVVTYAGPGEPLGAFLAVMAGVTAGHFVSGKTKVDILVTPIVTILIGSAVGLLIGPPISSLMTALGELINWGTECQPFLMGIVVSVIMGLCLTLPISSAALGILLGLEGIAAGAAVVGCCCQMVGFAVSSYRENRFGGLIAQGLGTSMLQMPNIIKHPLIWVPATLASAILGPVATKVLGLTCNAIGSGMGTAGLVGPIMTFQTLTSGGDGALIALGKIALILFILPALLSLLFSELMRKFGLIKAGDMALDL